MIILKTPPEKAVNMIKKKELTITKGGLTTKNGYANFKEVFGVVVAEKKIKLPNRVEIKSIIVRHDAEESKEKSYSHFVFLNTIMTRHSKYVLAGKSILVNPDFLQWEYCGRSWRVTKDIFTSKKIGKKKSN
jgi:hypothetical protein